MSDSVDIVVVGGGHAGIEAALAATRLGATVQLVTHARDEIGRMPCNPAIGGLGKGHLVREIDALGGQMGLAIDQTGIQFRILNRRKGPAVQSPRAQADKHSYQRAMLKVVLAEPRLTVREDEAIGLRVVGDPGGRRRVVGLHTAKGCEIACRKIILSTGTFLRGLMHIGNQKKSGGREGAASAVGLSGELKRLGFELRRLKTGTPPRLKSRSINFSALEPQAGDERPAPFSCRTREFNPDQVLCHLAYTSVRTHDIIRANLDRSPLYAGVIEGRGPRYCPSIEDKVVRFSDKSRHLLFLEPEGRESDEIYVNGLATSLPDDVQIAAVHSIRGLEEAELVRFGYAVEYDSIPSYQVRSTLESKNIDGLYLAGQIIGTSGYEEAAAQGLVAGINAFLSLSNQCPFILRRDEAYIGVLIDDLVTKDITEPYRIFTSRAEHRLHLRCDNAESRLLPHAEKIGLLPAGDLQDMRVYCDAAERVTRRLWTFQMVDPVGGGRLPTAELLRRPGASLTRFLGQDGPGQHEGEASRGDGGGNGRGNEQFRELRQVIQDTLASISGPALDVRDRERVLCQVENDIKYSGYIAKQNRILKKFVHMDNLELPEDLDYLQIAALSHEAREKLARMRPATLGQAGRIDGVRAGDLAVLTVVLKKHNMLNLNDIMWSFRGCSPARDSEKPPPPDPVL